MRGRSRAETEITGWPRSGRTAVTALATLLLLSPLAALGEGPAIEGDPIRLGVVTSYSPRLMFVKYQPLVDYLSASTGREWALNLSTSYESTVEDLCAGVWPSPTSAP